MLQETFLQGTGLRFALTGAEAGVDSIREQKKTRSQKKKNRKCCRIPHVRCRFVGLRIYQRAISVAHPKKFINFLTFTNTQVYSTLLRKMIDLLLVQ